METLFGIRSLGVIHHAAVTVGTFDGVHLGHMAVINQLRTVAEKINGAQVVVTFDVPPRTVIEPWNTDISILNTLEEKEERLALAGVEHLIILPFTLEFSKLSPEDFIKRILIGEIGMKAVVPGYDHMFGHGGSGGVELLSKMSREYGFMVAQSPEFLVDGAIVSSSLIRKQVNEGNVSVANSLLGYPYTLTGKVVYGKQLGRTIGFPTINIEPQNAMKLIPGNGVYAVDVILGGTKLKGMCNIGFRPTINGKGLTIEVNIFDFDEDVYGAMVCVSFLQKIREEKKFGSIEHLKEQLKKDREEITDLR